MSKVLEELKRLAYENACCRCQYYKNNECVNKDECFWKFIERELKDYENLKLKHKAMQDAVLDNFKKLKVLEIIKKRNVNICLLKDSDSVDEYNQICRYSTKYSNRNSYPELLTQDEFYLVKEMLL